MTLRPLRPSDIPILEARAAASGYPYPDPDDVEVVLVVEQDGQIVTACAAKRLVELYLWPPIGSPEIKMQALSLLHQEMAKELRELGHGEANVFLPPTIENKFGRRLMRSFGWVKNWTSFYRNF